MATEAEPRKNQKSPSTDKLEPRTVFVSHTHADRKLAVHLKVLIEAAFSGMVNTFISSDPTPPGGIRPGDEWYSAIHEQLAASQAVWVLATPTSIQAPWIYWEAGIGKASCPGALVVVCVGLSPEEVPSPLSNFQAYDGLMPGERGVGELIAKFGDQLGMHIADVLIENLAETWITAAKDHRPEEEAATSGQKVSPEQLNRLEALLSRFEAAGSAVRPSTPPEEEATASERRREAARREVAVARGTALGTMTVVFDEPAEFVGVITNAEPETIFRFREIDEDGDAQVLVSTPHFNRRFHIFLRAAALPSLPVASEVPGRAQAVVAAIGEALAKAE